jgi:penicillin V acylase-like amidase (Ntn superfamily)
MKKILSILVLFSFLILTFVQKANSCTRVVYQGTSGLIMTARSMDWRDPIPANLWVFPRGIERNGEAGSNSVQWKSKYGSVATSCWDIATADGMNEKGLVANLLWLGETEYPHFEMNGKIKGLAASFWAQYILDNFATVSEAVADFEKAEFVVVSDAIPGTDRFATIHLSISDASGDNAVMEYVKGKLVIHHDHSYNVMTNSPVFEQQRAIDTYWKGIPGTVMLPGTNRAADRYVRASYYISAIPKTDNTRVALASVFGVIRNCSVPLGISSPTEPNISSTRWRTVSDQKNLVYYFENVLNPNIVWVEFSKLDFREKSPVKKLTLENNENYAGESSKNFQSAQPMKFLGLNG